MNKKVVVNDKMQKDYVYFLSEPMGKNFHPEFNPDLTPKEMLELGVFGGKYMTDCRDEFPIDWFENAKLNSDFHDAKLNLFFRAMNNPNSAKIISQGSVKSDINTKYIFFLLKKGELSCS